MSRVSSRNVIETHGCYLEPCSSRRNLGDGLFRSVYEGTDSNGRRIIAKEYTWQKGRSFPKDILLGFRNERRLCWGQKGLCRIARPLEEYVDEDPQRLLLTWERISGPTLRKHLHEVATLRPEECAHLARGLLAALDHLHKLKYIHGDLSPDNIVLQHGLIIAAYQPLVLFEHHAVPFG